MRLAATRNLGGDGSGDRADHEFIVAAQTGGQVLGAFDGASSSATRLPWSALHHATPYLHSHHTGVHPTIAIAASAES